MSSKLSPESESGPYKFHSPARVAITLQRSCFACSQKLKDIAVEAVCEQDGHTRLFHICCWETNTPISDGARYRWNRKREVDKRARVRSKQDVEI